jgi:hypothetical protein
MKLLGLVMKRIWNRPSGQRTGMNQLYSFCGVEEGCDGNGGGEERRVQV